MAVALGLTLAACEASPADLMQHAASTASPSAANSPAASSPAGGRASASAAPPAWTAPLTGLRASGARAAGRPAVAVALSGSQLRGLGSADVVYEEVVSPLRYIAVFQSRADASIGPVGQTRPTDAQTLSVLHPLAAYDGGAPSFVRVLDQSGVVDVGYASHPSLYHPGVQGPSVSTDQVRQAGRDTAPPQLFTYRGSAVGDAPAFASTGAWRASILRITAPGQATQEWRFDSRTHGWRQVAGGPAVQVANIVVQTVPYKTVFLSRKYGLTTASARVVGTGPALILSETTTAAGGTGTAVKGTWSKPGLGDVTAYLDASNIPIGFQRGTTWVILVPPGTRTATAKVAGS